MKKFKKYYYIIKIALIVTASFLLVKAVYSADSIRVPMGLDDKRTEQAELALKSEGNVKKYNSLDELAKTLKIRHIPDNTGSVITRTATIEEMVRHELPQALFAYGHIVGLRQWMDKHGAKNRPLIIWQNSSLGDFFPFFSKELKEKLGVIEVTEKQLLSARFSLAGRLYTPKKLRQARYILLRFKIASHPLEPFFYLEGTLLRLRNWASSPWMRAPVISIDNSNTYLELSKGQRGALGAVNKIIVEDGDGTTTGHINTAILNKVSYEGRYSYYISQEKLLRSLLRLSNPWFFLKLVGSPGPGSPESISFFDDLERADPNPYETTVMINGTRMLLIDAIKLYYSRETNYAIAKPSQRTKLNLKSIINDSFAAARLCQ